MKYVTDAAKEYAKKNTKDEMQVLGDVDIDNLDPHYGPVCIFKVNDFKNFMIMKSWFAKESTLAHYLDKSNNMYVLFPYDEARWLEALEEMNIISDLELQD